MNAVEIEEAISNLAEQPFDAGEFPFAFLDAFGAKETTIKKLRKGETNKSDIGGLLQRDNIHIAVAAPGEVTATLAQLRTSPATTRWKARFILATDGEMFEAEDIETGETLACAYPDFPNHFGMFLSLAGITTVKQVRDSTFDIRATSRLNKLYLELLKDNPDWAAAARRDDMNHFMARLIFCFFAEDTDIFNGTGLFTATLGQFTDRDASNTAWVIGEIFRAMNVRPGDRAKAGLRNWADAFPYVNGGLFSGGLDVPRFSKIARTYLLHIGSLDWKQINPDIFGSMIQAVADHEERGALGMHYTSVPNILKVLNPLFLDELRKQLEEAADNSRKLLNLRNRMARIRVFDPACGSGNFLVIAYKQMREIEAEINRRRGEADLKSAIPLTNFRGIELRSFAAEIARLALIIAEYQCDVLYRGQKEALAAFLPLDAQNWITQGNALRIDWLTVCEPTGKGGGRIFSDDFFGSPLDQATVEFANEGGETYICGNPPFAGLTKQTREQKDDLRHVFSGTEYSASAVDYVLAWYHKAERYSEVEETKFAFVSTNSVCQGQSIPKFWKHFLKRGIRISFAHTSFIWPNLAKGNAGVIVVIVGGDRKIDGPCFLYSSENKLTSDYISLYLTSAHVDLVEERSHPIHELSALICGSIPNCNGNLVLTAAARRELSLTSPEAAKFIRRYVGSQEISKGIVRYALLISNKEVNEARLVPEIDRRLEAVVTHRRGSDKANTRDVLSVTPHRFELTSSIGGDRAVAISRTTSENRDVLACDIVQAGTIVNDNAYFAESDQTLTLSIVTSRLHLVWIATICGRMKND